VLVRWPAGSEGPAGRAVVVEVVRVDDEVEDEDVGGVGGRTVVVLEVVVDDEGGAGGCDGGAGGLGDPVTPIWLFPHRPNSA